MPQVIFLFSSSSTLSNASSNFFCFRRSDGERRERGKGRGGERSEYIASASLFSSSLFPRELEAADEERVNLLRSGYQNKVRMDEIDHGLFSEGFLYDI